MDAIHTANELYWRRGEAATSEERTQYRKRLERLEQIRLELAQLGRIMNKPHLVILSDDTDPILRGRCSSCEGVTFSLSRDTESSLALMHGMFSEHFKQVHMHEDASQSTSNAK
jgi:hypothetical protein